MTAFDNVSDATRKTMRANRAKNTRPEMIVRRLVHGMGYRYRLHRRDLPGCPDLVFPSRRKVIFVHGCFWHRHQDPSCKIARMPKSRLEFWGPKLTANRARDGRDLAALEKIGWKALVVWECTLRDDMGDEAASLSGQALSGKLKAGVDAVAGIGLDDVKVHLDSLKPAALAVQAYTQGSEIHLAPEQGKHMPREAWHVVQRPSAQKKEAGNVKNSSNDDIGLEAEADQMGAHAAQSRLSST